MPLHLIWLTFAGLLQKWRATLIVTRSRCVYIVIRPRVHVYISSARRCLPPDLCPTCGQSGHMTWKIQPRFRVAYYVGGTRL